MKAAELPGLNLLRVLAALYMVMYHLNAPFLPHAIQAFFSRGTSGTGLFFLLSGFLLAHLYAGHPMDDAGQRRFVWRRVARIFPANALGLLFLLAVEAFEGRPLHDWNGLTESLLLIQSWVVGDTHLLNAPAWSMSCLLFFYLLFPVLLPRLERLKTVALASLLAALWLAGISVPLALVSRPGAYDASDWVVYLHNSPLFRAPEFVLGLGLALLVARHRQLGSPRLTRGLRLAVAATLALMMLAPKETAAVNNGLYAPLSAALLLAALQPGRALTRLGRSGPVRALASASICVFLLHMTWLRLFGDWALPHWHLGWTPLTAAAYLALTLASSLALDRWICQPLARLLTRRTAATERLPVSRDERPALAARAA